MNDELSAEADAERAVFKARLRLACIWAWPVCGVTFFGFFAGFARFFPPPHPSWSAVHFAQYYADHRTGIRVGLLGAMFASSLLLPFLTVVSQEIRRIEGRGALLAPIQQGGNIMLTLVFQIICLFWLLASFRPELEPNTIRAFTDFGWFVWSMYIPTYMLQFIAMALAGFMDKREVRLWPRWLAWFFLWVAVLGAGGVLAVFFKHGPFAYNGLMGFYIPVIVFAAGMTFAFFYMRKRHLLEHQATRPAHDSVFTSAGQAAAMGGGA